MTALNGDSSATTPALAKYSVGGPPGVISSGAAACRLADNGKRSANRHDRWCSLRRDAAARIVEIGLPHEVLATERTFREFLTVGHLEGVPFTLDDLPPDRIMPLFHFATENFDFDTADFTALEALRIRHPRA